MTITFQEVRVLRLLLQGSTDAQIAAALGMKVRTVKYHVSALYRNYGVHTRADLIAVFGTFEVTVTWKPRINEKTKALYDNFICDNRDTGRVTPFGIRPEARGRAATSS